MIRKTNKYYWIAQCFGWFSYSGLLLLSVYTNNPERLTASFFYGILILIFSGILTTHLQRLFFIRAGWLELKLPALIPRLLVISFFASIIIASIDFAMDYLSGIRLADDIRVSQLIVNIFAVLVLVLFWNAIYFTYHFFQKSRKQEVSNLQLAASKRESELRNLRSQLNPHFLFNSLNSIRALVDIEPQKAKIAITSLSNLLRESLLLGKENLIPLSSELGVARHYLDLEKMRFEERLDIEWNLDESLNSFLIPPFSIQMMIENAIKHGISNLVDGGKVVVNTYQENDKVVVEVRNSGTLKTVKDLGVGIRNVQKRLKLQFGAGAKFNLVEVDQEVVAKIVFKNESI